MKRFVPRILTASFCVLFVLSAQAGIFRHSKKDQIPNQKNPLAGSTSKQPDKVLFEKAMKAMQKGRYDVARLDLQTLLNTYPESEYQMRAKLAVGDTWFKEGGTAALAQAEAEYKDFITFFPNQPEAAEAQMKVADIYFDQMEKPDRDATNADRAQQEYRTMIQQYPDSPLVPRAKQRLREVQEVLAERQFEVGTFYASHENWPATIARLQTLVDAYPLYSKSDQALIGLGDAYAAEARIVQNLRLEPKAKQELMKIYDDRAAEAYDRVVTRYSMSPHVEDARERLIALNRPVPEPTAKELAESESEEQSRTGISFGQRALFLIKRGPVVTLNAARVGNPTMTDPAPITAPDVTKNTRETYEAVIKGKPIPPAPGAMETADAAQNAANPAAAPAPEDTGAPLQLENVAPAGSSPGGASIGASIVSTGEGNAAPATDPNGAAAAAAAGVPGAASPGGIAPVGPTNNKPLPPVEKPAEAPMQTNDVHGNAPAQVQTGTGAGVGKKKNPKPKYNSGEESSSKHKKKKGVKKINPF